MLKVIVDYRNERDAEAHSFADIIIQHMDKNLNFPAPFPSVADFTITVADYKDALTAAGNHDRQAVARKNTLKKAVIAGLRSWAMYVNTVSQGDLDKLVSSNFVMAKQRQPVKLVAPVIKQVLQGPRPGSLVAKVKKGKGTKTLLYQIAKDPVTETTEWVTFGDSRSKFEFINLDEGKKYWIRVIGIGTNNQSLQSDEVALFVLQRSMATSKSV